MEDGFYAQKGHTRILRYDLAKLQWRVACVPDPATSARTPGETHERWVILTSVEQPDQAIMVIGITGSRQFASRFSSARTAALRAQAE